MHPAASSMSTNPNTLLLHGEWTWTEYCLLYMRVRSEPRSGEVQVFLDEARDLRTSVVALPSVLAASKLMLFVPFPNFSGQCITGGGLCLAAVWPVKSHVDTCWSLLPRFLPVRGSGSLPRNTGTVLSLVVVLSVLVPVHLSVC